MSGESNILSLRAAKKVWSAACGPRAACGHVCHRPYLWFCKKCSLNLYLSVISLLPWIQIKKIFFLCFCFCYVLKCNTTLIAVHHQKTKEDIILRMNSKFSVPMRITIELKRNHTTIFKLLFLTIFIDFHLFLLFIVLKTFFHFEKNEIKKRQKCSFFSIARHDSSKTIFVKTIK